MRFYCLLHLNRTNKLQILCKGTKKTWAEKTNSYVFHNNSHVDLTFRKNLY